MAIEGHVWQYRHQMKIRTEILKVRVTPEFIARLDKLAKKWLSNRSNIIRQAVTDFLARRDK